MAYDADDRITVVAAATTVGVSVDLGEAQVNARVPLPAGAAHMDEQQLRSASLKAARRALEIVLQDLQSAGG